MFFGGTLLSPLPPIKGLCAKRQKRRRRRRRLPTKTTLSLQQSKGRIVLQAKRCYLFFFFGEFHGCLLLCLPFPLQLRLIFGDTRTHPDSPPKTRYCGQNLQEFENGRMLGLAPLLPRSCEEGGLQFSAKRCLGCLNQLLGCDRDLLPAVAFELGGF